jgi:hypothetical protein
MRDNRLGIVATGVFLAALSILYYVAVVFICGYVVLWLLQYFHVLGMGCACP